MIVVRQVYELTLRKDLRLPREEPIPTGTVLKRGDGFQMFLDKEPGFVEIAKFPGGNPVLVSVNDVENLQL